MTLLLSILLALSPALPAVACPLSGGKPLSKSEIRKLREKSGKAKREPDQAMDPLYGGANPGKWTIEAVLANLFKSQIETALKSPDVADVVVSVPANLVDGGWAPFGDGQTNSRPAFGPHWTHAEPPLVVRREILRSGGHRDVITAHPSLGVKNFNKKQAGETLFIQPQGWSSWFGVSFKHQNLPVDEFERGLPSGLRLSGGRALTDPEKIRSKIQGRSAYQALLSHSFGSGYQGPFPPSGSVHGRFPDAGGSVTAVGGVTTWLIEQDSIKHLYTCFEGRNTTEEAAHGVPSGAGWHRVGTYSETVLNTLEQAPILAALGRINEDPVPNGQESAYGLKGVLTARYLRPGEALMTNRGQFHWYAIDSRDEACTEILVHACVPDALNQMGFDCR